MSIKIMKNGKVKQSFLIASQKRIFINNVEYVFCSFRIINNK
jgi:hypothetical protein